MPQNDHRQLFHQVTIVGMGLIGGSLGMAIRKQRLAGQVVGVVRRAKTIQEAKRRRALHWGTTNLAEGVRDADLVVVATPLALVLPTIRKIVPLMKPGAILTDVGSTKREIVSGGECAVQRKISVSRSNRAAGKWIHFVGGHPMAGKEVGGIAAADTNLFRGAPYLFTPTKKTHRPALRRLVRFVRKLQVRVAYFSPEEHDALVALVSHLPYVAATALVQSARQEAPAAQLAKIVGSGFRDTSRVAGGHPPLGADICLGNRTAVRKGIARLQRELAHLDRLIQQGDRAKLLRLLRDVGAFRQRVVA